MIVGRSRATTAKPSPSSALTWTEPELVPKYTPAAKVAALYAQGTRDSLIIETASDLGQITSNISGKIWQKITLVQHHIEVQPPSSYEVDELSPALLGQFPPQSRRNPVEHQKNNHVD